MSSTRVSWTIDEHILTMVQREAEQAGKSVSAWVSDVLRHAAVRSDAARLGEWVARHAEVHEAWRSEAEAESEAVYREAQHREGAA